MQLITGALTSLCLAALLSSCASPEVKAQRESDRAAAAQQLSSRIPAMATVFEKACIPYLNEVPVEQIETDLNSAGYEATANLRRSFSDSLRVLTNKDSGVQVQLQTKSAWEYDCIVIADYADSSVGTDDQKVLREKTLEVVRSVGEQFAASRNGELRKTFGTKDYFINFRNGPDFKFISPVHPGGRTVLMVASRFPSQHLSQ